MTRVLFVDHPEGDMLAGVLWQGLRLLLGGEDAIDWPYKPSYHGRSDDTYHLPDGKRGFTAPFDWMLRHEGREWQEQEVADRIREFDLVILASPRQLNKEALERLISRVGRPAIRRLAIVDGEDSTDVRWDRIAQFGPDVTFKRELLPGADRGARILPCPFGSPLHEPLPAVEKDLDVVFLGGDNFPGGRAALDGPLREAFGARYEGSARLPHRDYLRLLSRAKVAVATRGHGWDALRLWEVPSCPGTLLLRDRNPLVQHRPFVHDEHCGYFESPGQAVELARRYVGDDGFRRRLAESGNRHLWEHHSARARAQYVLEESLR